MGSACLKRQWTLAGLTLALATFGLPAQNVPARLRGVPNPPAANGQSTPATQAQGPAPASQPTSLLQEPAHAAQVILNGESLSIRADNSSLSAILHEIASKSGMQIEGLSGDERVFGNFGPGVPRDVLADLLNGTAYNVMLLGDLRDGAPRQLILTPATHSGAAPVPAPQVNSEDANGDSEATEIPPPQPDVPAEPGTPPPASGVKSPQQLFEQLQRMRQTQGQQQQDPQQQQQQ